MLLEAEGFRWGSFTASNASSVGCCGLLEAAVAALVG